MKLEQHINQNNKIPKKMKLGVIIGIVMVIIIAVIVVLFLLTKSKDLSNSLFKSNIKTITAEEIDSYNLESSGRWGNLSLGISYLIPLDTEWTGHIDFYPHGHSFGINLYDIKVEKSLEGSNNLYTLPVDIYKEKESDKYSLERKEYHSVSNIIKTEEIKINNFDTVYFESGISTATLMENADEQYIGYSLKYNNQYITVYGHYYIDKNIEKNKSIYYNSNKDQLNKILQYIINSFEIYNGESFYELDNNFNFKMLYNSGTVSKFDNEVVNNERQFMVNNAENYRYRLLKSISFQENEWDGNYDTIFETIQKNENELRELDFLNFGTDGILSKYEIIEESKVVINGIDMKKYLISDKFAGQINYAVLYTFVVDNNPYIFQFYNTNLYYDKDYTDEQKKVLLDLVDIQGSTTIRTIRFIENYDEFLDYK